MWEAGEKNDGGHPHEEDAEGRPIERRAATEAGERLSDRDSDTVDVAKEGGDRGVEGEGEGGRWTSTLCGLIELFEGR